MNKQHHLFLKHCIKIFNSVVTDIVRGLKTNVFTFFFITSVCIPSCSEEEKKPAFVAEPEDSTENKSYTAYFGVNLAGGEFGKTPGTYNVDYTYPTMQELDYFKSKGLKLIRLPFKWERIQPTLGEALNVTELNRLVAVVDSASSRGLFIVLDMHNYGRRKVEGSNQIIGTPAVKIEDIKYAWREIANTFKSKTNIWGYGIMNEPHDMLTSPTWFTIAQQIIAGIRTTDTTTSIIVGGDSWSSAERWVQSSDSLKYLADPSKKIIFEAHVYFDDDASGTYNDTYDNEKANANTGVTRVTPFVNWLKSNKLKGFIGEYGVPNNDSRWLIVLDNFLAFLKSNCINGTYWAAGPWWGNYSLSVEPKNGADQPQMSVLKYHLGLESNCP